MQSRVRIKHSELLSDDWYVLKKTTFDFLTSRGEWVEQTRETYDRGNGATILLYNAKQRTVVLTRQFRLPAYLNGHPDGFLVEAAAGLLDGATPEERIRAEAQEETGYRVGAPRRLWDAFMSPGSVTERVHFFVAEYDAADRVGDGGGVAQEGEDLEVLELDIDAALAMIGTAIVDGKTIMLLQYAQAHLFAPRSMMILIAGPYRSGTGEHPALIARNVEAMEECVMPLYRAGHLPVLGEWLALPTARLAGSTRPGDAAFDALFHPHAQRLLARCDAVLRIGGASSGADLMVDTAQRLGKRVFYSIGEIAPAV